MDEQGAKAFRILVGLNDMDELNAGGCVCAYLSDTKERYGLFIAQKIAESVTAAIMGDLDNSSRLGHEAFKLIEGMKS